MADKKPAARPDSRRASRSSRLLGDAVRGAVPASAPAMSAEPWRTRGRKSAVKHRK